MPEKFPGVLVEKFKGIHRYAEQLYVKKIARINLNTLTVGEKNKNNRDAWVENALKHVPPGSRILDAGAGEQQYKRLCSHLEYISQDFVQYSGKGNGKGLQLENFDASNVDIISDIAKIPEPDASFDAIMCTEVFEHLPEPVKAIQEFARLIKPGGLLILTAPFCSLTHMAPYHFYSGFNRYFFEACLSNYDFEIIEIQGNGNYFEYLAQELRRIPLIANRYSNGRLKNIESLAIKICLSMLERFTDQDTGSTEVLNFGYHILARKNEPAKDSNIGCSRAS